MKSTQRSETDRGVSRRDFVKTGAAAAAGIAFMKTGNFAYAAGSETIRYGLVGAGGRGTGAAVNAFQAAPGVELVAMGDLFEDHLDDSREKLEEQLGDAFKVTPETSFVGWDAYKHVVDSDVDVVIFAEPPAFRAAHVRYGVERGRHVFMEKPVAVDPVGARAFFDIADMADEKGLAIVAGTQRRHERRYLETIQRIHDGAIGEIISGQVFWNQGALWNKPRQAGWSDMEYQLRNWLYYTHLSGDHIVEQHIHNIDVANWVLQSHPIRAVGVGGRAARVAPEYGHIFDNFAVDLEYPNGARILSMARQQEGTAAFVGEHIMGSKGTSNAASWIRGENTFRFDGDNPNPYVQEHTNLIESIRNGQPINEARRMAETNLSAVMAREAAYTGLEITWEDIMNSTQDLMPEKWEFTAMTTPQVAVPGVTPLNRRPWDGPSSAAN